MEPLRHEENRQPVLNFKCEKIVSRLDNSSSSAAEIINKEKCKLETNEELFAFPTPAKAPQPSRRSKKLEEVRLPDNFQIVGELFDGLETSVRLLRLCKKPVTFQNVCIQVEILTKRKLLHKHLAQMKYVIPEFILLESSSVHDQKSFCMLPDVKITLLSTTPGKTETSIIKPEAGDSKPLRDVFWTRLRKMILDHPEVVDIPEAAIPEPFNSNSNTFANEVSSSVTTDSTAGMPWTHFSSSFEQRFSNVLQHHQQTKAPLLSSSAPNFVIGNSSNSFVKHSSPIKQDSEFEKIGSSQSAASIMKPHLGQCSPVVHPLTPAQAMSKVVAQETPKRSAEIRTVLNINRRRSLKFNWEDANGSDSEQILSLSKEKRERDCSSCEFEKLVGPSIDKEASGRIPPAFSPKDAGTAKKMTSGRKMREADLGGDEQLRLTDLFSTISRILQSAKCPYFTKQELLHKILFYSSETFETSEIEEKLKLLEELAPEWISQKVASSGDFLYCFSKGPDASAIYARLAEAA